MGQSSLCHVSCLRHRRSPDVTALPLSNPDNTVQYRSETMHSQTSLIHGGAARWTAGTTRSGAGRCRQVRVDAPVQMERCGTVSLALALSLLPLNATTWKPSLATRTSALLSQSGTCRLDSCCSLPPQQRVEATRLH